MTKRVFTTGALGAAAALALVLAADAALAGQGGARFMERFDADGDGTVTRAEMLDASAGRFAEVDADGDGTVTLAEFEAHRIAKVRERIAKHFGRLDSDGDGAVSEEENAARAGTWFDRVDADGDGSWSADELAAMRRHHGHHRRDG